MLFKNITAEKEIEARPEFRTNYDYTNKYSNNARIGSKIEVYSCDKHAHASSYYN